MIYSDTGSPLSADAFEHARAILDVDAAALWAVLDAESRGFGFLPSRRPVILYERQVFHRLTGGRFDQEFPELSNAAPGGYLGGTAEYTRLNAASTLDAGAALESTSWGIGQLMGFNYGEIGYPNVERLVAEMVDSEDNQIWATAAFIEEWAINEELRDHAWEEFAGRYNGSGAVRDGYAAKLAVAYDRFRLRLPDFDVRDAQVALLYLGFHPGPIDGIIGPRTRAALVAFQRKHQLPVTGTLDDRMAEVLSMAAFAA